MDRDLPPMNVTALQARQFVLRACGMASRAASVGEVIRHLGSIQMDPIDVCGKMHDLILRNRVVPYRRDGLLSLLYADGSREFFEHYLPRRGILVALPVTDYRFLCRTMRTRRRKEGYGGLLRPEEKKLSGVILRRIREEGPLGSAAFLNDTRSETGWGTMGSLAKTTLDKLFFQGRLLIARRENFRRIFDLPERILPREILQARPASPREEARWLVMERLRQRRLVSLTSAQRELVGKVVQPVRIGGSKPLYCLIEDVGHFDTQAPLLPPTLLAPLDPLLYDRAIARVVWKFDYTWEVYTPPAKRVRGYYALPLLVGHEIVGHVDPRADRPAGILFARTDVANKAAVLSALRPLATFLGLKSVQVDETKLN